MPILLSKERVAVTIDGKNVIYIRPKLNLGAQTRLVDGLKMRKTADGRAVVGVGEGEAIMILLQETIVDWEGPEFEVDGKVLPVTLVTLQEIDVTDPLFLEVRNRVQDLYLQASDAVSSPNLPASKKSTRSTSKP